ncbi:MAG: hypothetical protein BWY82_02266 [Verrucomicrobia bacterium ADurb.Bin474]|nr:MAG: hypothetical protein BWY82_02266 [Verrucomicrobia bacterium ADurb.Bin474]
MLARDEPEVFHAFRSFLHDDHGFDDFGSGIVIIFDGVAVDRCGRADDAQEGGAEQRECFV